MTGHHLPPPITCVDDVEGALSALDRRQFIEKWGRLLIIGPFFLLLIVSDFLKSHALDPSDTVTFGLICVWAVWGGGMICYYIYLRLTCKCPRCDDDFGAGERCRHCGLPKHPPDPAFDAEVPDA